LTHNYAGRNPMYIEENPSLKVYPLGCVPDSRPKGSWTNGVKAYNKEGGTKGWFYPPRLRNKGHNPRIGYKPSIDRGISIDNAQAHLTEGE